MVIFNYIAYYAKKQEGYKSPLKIFLVGLASIDLVLRLADAIVVVVISLNTISRGPIYLGQLNQAINTKAIPNEPRATAHMGLLACCDA